MIDLQRMHAPQSGLWNMYSQRRFSILLAMLLGILAGPAVLFDSRVSAGRFDELMALLLLAVILSLCVERRQRLFAFAFGFPTVLLSVCGSTLPLEVSEPLLFLGHICQICFFFGAAALIVRSLFNESQLSLDSVLGAVCGYLFLGLGWAVAYLMIDRFRPGSFAVSPSPAPRGDANQLAPSVLTYYSFVTLTTMGYGDITPIKPAARALAWMEAIAGQFYLAVIVAGIVSMIVANANRSRES
jgi:voltage-gated potassium channel